MRCPKCGKTNYSEVGVCHACGESLTAAPGQQQQTATHRFGPCPHCGNPQAEYFAAGRGQCRACVRTFTWKQELLQKEKPPEDDKGKSTMLMIIVAVIAIALVASAVGVWYYLEEQKDDGGGGGGGGIKSEYIGFGGVTAYPATPQPGDNVSINAVVQFKKPTTYNETNVHVTLSYTYATMSEAVANDAVSMVPQNGSNALTSPGGNVVFTLAPNKPLNLDNVKGPVTFVVEVYSAKEWAKPDDRRVPMAVSPEYSSALTYPGA